MPDSFFKDELKQSDRCEPHGGVLPASAPSHNHRVITLVVDRMSGTTDTHTPRTNPSAHTQIGGAFLRALQTH